MNKFTLLILCLFSFKAYCQNPGEPLKMEVPAITMGENLNFQALSFEPLARDKFSVLYFQEIPATIMGQREFRSEKMTGAFSDAEGKKFVNHSNSVIILVRQTLHKSAAPTTDYWVIAMRELQSQMGYSLHYPPNFVHPIVKNGTEVFYSLKNVGQIDGLSPREFEALVLLAKQKYGFYSYPEPTFSVKQATLADELAHMQSGFKELGAVFGKGDIPKGEKLLFKREVVDNIRMAGTKIDKKDSVEVKLYISTGGDTNYELLKKQTYKGSITPNFSSVLIYDKSLRVSGALGYMVLKYRDDNGQNKSNAFAMGIDNNGEGQFWRLDVGKNQLGSFVPTFSYIDEDGLHVISYNNEKVFKPFNQHHLLKKDGSAVALYPTDPAEVSSDKSQFVSTEQPSTSGYASAQYSTESKTEVPVGILEHNKSKFILSGVKTYNNTGATTVTTYGNLTVMRIDGNNKIKESIIINENKSAAPVSPRLLGKYQDKSYYVINYPNKFKLILSDDKAETEPLESSIYKLVYMPNENYVSSNQFGNMVLTKTIVGNKYVLEFYPAR